MFDMVTALWHDSPLGPEVVIGRFIHTTDGTSWVCPLNSSNRIILLPKGSYSSHSSRCLLCLLSWAAWPRSPVQGHWEPSSQLKWLPCPCKWCLSPRPSWCKLVLMVGFGGTLWVSSSDGSLLRHAVTPRKLGVCVTFQITSSSCMGEGLSCGMVAAFNNSVLGIQTTFSPSCRTSVLDLLIDRDLSGSHHGSRWV